MTQHAQEQIAGVINRLSVVSYRLRDSLINRFIESREVFNIGCSQPLMMSHPLLHNTCAKRPVFGDHLVDVKTIGKAKSGMNLSRALGKRIFWRAHAARFIKPLSRSLRRFEVVCNKPENIHDMILQS